MNSAYNSRWTAALVGTAMTMRATGLPALRLLLLRKSRWTETGRRPHRAGRHAGRHARRHAAWKSAGRNARRDAGRLVTPTRVSIVLRGRGRVARGQRNQHQRAIALPHSESVRLDGHDTAASHLVARLDFLRLTICLQNGVYAAVRLQYSRNTLVRGSHRQA